MTGANVCQPAKTSHKVVVVVLFAGVMLVTSVAMGAILGSGLLLVQSETVKKDRAAWEDSVSMWTEGTCTVKAELPSSNWCADGAAHRRRRLLAASAGDCVAQYTVELVPAASSSTPAPTPARRRLGSTSTASYSNQTACYYPCGMKTHYHYDAPSKGASMKCWYGGADSHHYDVKLTNVPPSRMLESSALDSRALTGTLLIPVGILLLIPSVVAFITLKLIAQCTGEHADNAKKFKRLCGCTPHATHGEDEEDEEDEEKELMSDVGAAKEDAASGGGGGRAGASDVGVELPER
jgi:hypothetical protein